MKNKEQHTFPFIEHLLDGAKVEWKKLGDVAEIYGGLTGKSKSDFENGNALFVSYKNIYDHYEINTLELSKVKVADTEKQHKIEYGDVLFTGSSETAEDVAFSSAVTMHFNESVYLNSFSFGVRFHKDIKLIPEFSKHLFRGRYMRKQLTKTANGVTRFNVSKKRFKNIFIPIPPLSVQERIVEILDKFTTLEAELEAELDCRKRQYEFYRNQLLTFEYEAVEWKKLGEVAEIGTGGSNRKDEEENGAYPFYVRSKNILRSSTYQFNETAIIIPGEGGIGDIYHFVNGKYALHQRAYRVHLHTNELLDKFVYHFMRSNFKVYIVSKSVGATATSIRKPMLESFLIPIPPLAEQERIVSILDKFDTLTTSISEGLPKEIELRRKQYEYYRERLLSFKH